MKLSAIVLTTLCTLSSLCGALDLSVIRPNLTRSQADNLYKTPYRYSVLEDVTVRREWSDAEHTLKLDFEISKDSLVMAEVHYDEPVDIELASQDADALAGEDLGKWLRAKTEQCESIGLSDSYYARTKDNRFFFIEATKDKKATCLIYFANIPRDNRRELEEASTNSYSAMGTNPASEAAKVVNEDEEFRLAQFVKKNKTTSRRSSGSSSRTTSSSSAVKGVAATITKQSTSPSGDSSRSQSAQVDSTVAPAVDAPAATPTSVPRKRALWLI